MDERDAELQRLWDEKERAWREYEKTREAYRKHRDALRSARLKNVRVDPSLVLIGDDKKQ